MLLMICSTLQAARLQVHPPQAIPIIIRYENTFNYYICIVAVYLVCTLYLQSRFGEKLISDEQEKAYFERIGNKRK